MAEAAKRASTKTTLYIGGLTAEVGLYQTAGAEDKVIKFDMAGPSGGRLRAETRAAPIVDMQRIDVPGDDPFGAETTPVPAQPVPQAVDLLGDIPVADTSMVDEQLAKSWGSVGQDVPVPKEYGDSITRGDKEPGVLADISQEAQPTQTIGEFKSFMVEEGTDAIVEPGDVRRGIYVDGPDGERFVDLTDQVHEIEEKTKLERIDVIATIDRTRVTSERVIGAHYVGTSDKKAPVVLRLLFETLASQRQAAVVKYTVGKRQRLGVIVASKRHDALLMLQLVYFENWREVPSKAHAMNAVEVIEQVTDGRLAMMEAILENLHDTPDVLNDVADEAIALRRELLARAATGEMDTFAVKHEAPKLNENDLDALLDGAVLATRK